MQVACTYGVGVDGVGGEQEPGQGGEARAQRRHRQAHPGHEYAGRRVQGDVGRVVPTRRQPGRQVVQPERRVSFD